jgi:hypothetical protein
LLLTTAGWSGCVVVEVVVVMVVVACSNDSGLSVVVVGCGWLLVGGVVVWCGVVVCFRWQSGKAKHAEKEYNRKNSRILGCDGVVGEF